MWSVGIYKVAELGVFFIMNLERRNQIVLHTVSISVALLVVAFDNVIHENSATYLFLCIKTCAMPNLLARKNLHMAVRSFVRLEDETSN